MAFMTVIECHMTASKYVNMGIKLTVLIPVLQKNKRFSIFTHRGIKKWSYLISKFCPLYFPL